MSRHARAALGNNPLLGDLLPNLSSPSVASPSAAFPFGNAIDPAADGKRLTTQLQRVEAVMADGFARTLPGICAELHKRFPGSHYAETAVSARLRDMRRHGWKVKSERSRPGSGLYLYRAEKLEVADEAA